MRDLGPSTRSAAVDAVLAPLVRGPRVQGRVVVATRQAAYARLDAPASPLVALLAADAVRVPASIVLADAAGLVTRLHAGDAIAAGEGAVEVAGVRLVPRRWWSSAVPRVAPPAVAPPAPVLSRLPDEVAVAVEGLEEALAAGEAPVGHAVDELLGLGPGLTPAGDDVLAGALVALAATGTARPRRALADAVRPARHRTTVVSAALLEHAARGRAAPELARYVVALARQQPDPAVVQDLEQVGGTSGLALAAGAVIGLRLAARSGSGGATAGEAAA